MMWEKIKNRFISWVSRLADLWEQKRYGSFTLLLLSVPVSIGLAIFLFWIAALGLIGFVAVHFIEIAVIVGLPTALLSWIAAKKSERLEQRKELDEKERQRRLAEYNARKESTYDVEAKMLFPVARELSGVGLNPPMRLSNLYSPCRTLPRSDGAVILCQFLIQKSQEIIDTDLIKHLAQTKIDQRLASGEYPGMKQYHIFEGRSFSSFMVTDVVDGEGFIEVYTVLVNNEVCLYLQSRDLNRDIAPRQTDKTDLEY
ncbi:MAG: hypothetical protein K0Q87_1235 [Neobacillus sp.]|jgi:hypothetical protein|nr:hypothetical protein [Neobacillus sp.]